VNRKNKEKIVEKYSTLLNSYETVFLIKNLGLSVLDLKRIRSKLKGINSKILFIKNSLMKIALNNVSFPLNKDVFCGPFAIIYTNDSIAVSKLLMKLCNDISNLDIVGGADLDRQFNKDYVMWLSTMPSQDEIRTKLVFLAKFVADKVVKIINEPNVKIVRIIQSYIKKE